MNPDTKDLAERYLEILREYVGGSSETSLSRGYELARRALRDGYGVLELAAIHHQALRRVFIEHEASDGLLTAAGEFFAECLSPYEMSHRGAQEGTRALRHLNEVLEAELKRIAHALHDEAGQLLASVHIAIADVASELPPRARRRLDGVELLLKQIEAELRSLSHELRPTVLDNLGLVPALDHLAEKVAKRTGLIISITGETGERLPAAVETALYRIVQEALNNVVKHAHAHSVWIELQRTRLKILCAIRDDGMGFDAVDRRGKQGLGLSGIRERLNSLGGSLSVVTEPRRGTTLLAGIPLKN
jgi:two-component system sensor histidine kinase UhpB